MPKTMQVLSDAGAAFIGRFEGFRGELYNDPAGHCTIGYGHLVHQGNCNGSEPAAFRKGITQQQALKLLKEDAASAGAAVSAAVTVPLNQAQFDALVSFVFNLGAGNFRSSSLLKTINAHDFKAVPAALNQWVHAGGKVLPGLVTRRKAEGKLFSTGAYV